MSNNHYTIRETTPTDTIEIARVIREILIEFGYEKYYLEILPYMKNARKLYKRSEFKSLEYRLGNTGHFSCNMWMIKEL